MIHYDISVVLATRNRAPSLARLLDGLTDQVDAPCFEVIVADNGSSDDTPAVIEQAGKKLTVQYVREERPGKGRALNAALKLVRGDLIVFTDDDVQPFPDWLFQMHKVARDYPECNVFGGRIIVEPESVPKWIRKSYNLMGLLAARHEKKKTVETYRYGQYPLGPNMAIRRFLINGVNDPYPIHIGPGTAWPVGDEARFFLPLSPPGKKERIYVDKARVQHAVEAENIAFLSALRRCFLAGRAYGWLGLKNVVSSDHITPDHRSVIASRIKTCRGLREFFCLAARYAGYLIAGHEVRSGRVCQPEYVPLPPKSMSR